MTSTIKTRLAALERKAGSPDRGALHHHVEVTGDGGEVLRSFCGRVVWHGQRCVGNPDITLRLPDNGRADADFWP